MKTTILSLIALICLTSIVRGRQQPKPSVGNATIDIAGATFHVGMTKSEVVEKLAGKQFTKSEEDFWIVAKPNELGPALQFTDGRLT